MHRTIANLGASLCALAVVVAVQGALTAQRLGASGTVVQTLHASEAPALVQAALDAELAGDAAKRAALLAEALEADPEFAPARWQNGQVKFDGRWRTPAEVQNLVASHPRWVGYRRLRDSLGFTPADHLQLAEYCDENSLANEGRYHWANVLLAQPNHELARKRLGLRRYHGGLFTAEQVAQLEKFAKDAKENLEHYQPVMTALCRDAIGSDEARRAQALAKLRAVDDPAAIEALGIAVEKASAKSSRFAGELQLAMVAALANMPQHDATLRLLNIAVLSDRGDVGAAAAAALGSRPQTDYVPLLMAALTAPVNVEFDVLATPDGTVRLLETVVQDGPEANRVRVRSTNYETEGAEFYDRSASNPGVVLQTHLADAEALAEDARASAEDANDAAAARNARIFQVLRIASGSDLGSDADKAWAAWEDANEIQYATEKVNYVSYSEFTHVYEYPQAHPAFVPENGPASGTTGVQMRPEPASEPVKRMNPAVERPNQGRPMANRGLTRTPHSCFVPGTPVWTEAGPTPIEKVAVGDFVLSQNPATGELAFRPVLQTTIGTPTRVLNVRLPKETIGATLGHRFWVNGRGWAMAKLLEPSASLHGLRGPVPVEAIAEAEQAACYNLVVDEFHSYFVGKSQILVHDRTCPEPAVASVPGSATVRIMSPLDAPIKVTKSAW